MAPSRSPPSDIGADALISVEDDGSGMDPEQVAAHAGRASHDAGARIGLGNMDDRLRQVYGDEYGLVVETAPGAGTKVSVRIPKFAPGVTALS